MFVSVFTLDLMMVEHVCAFLVHNLRCTFLVHLLHRLQIYGISFVCFWYTFMCLGGILVCHTFVQRSCICLDAEIRCTYIRCMSAVSVSVSQQLCWQECYESVTVFIMMDRGDSGTFG